jgi:C1A family cysteine protease
MYDGMISPKDNVMEATGSPRFGHAMAIVEANDLTEELKVRNSWSKYWADKGHAYMPYKMIEDKDVIYDIYVIKLYEG